MVVRGESALVGDGLAGDPQGGNKADPVRVVPCVAARAISERVGHGRAIGVGQASLRPGVRTLSPGHQSHPGRPAAPGRSVRTVASAAYRAHGVAGTGLRSGVGVVLDQLDVENVSKRYGDTVALRDLSFTVHPGELFGFVGRNGSGKTTTMRIALGVLSADSGQVLLSGRPIDLDARRRIGYMPEERGRYPKMKVGAQLAYLAQLHGLSSAEAADAVARWTTRLDIAHRVDDTVGALSLGNQQRVQLAAALVHD